MGQIIQKKKTTHFTIIINSIFSLGTSGGGGVQLNDRWLSGIGRVNKHVYCIWRIVGPAWSREQESRSQGRSHERARNRKLMAP